MNICLSRADLHAYVCGALDRGAHRMVEEHVDGCLTCQQTVDTLDGLSSALLSGLSAVPVAVPPDPLLERLIDRVKHPERPACGSAAEFAARLRRSGLLSAAEFDALGPDVVARQLVARGVLTEFQAAEIEAGREDGLVLGAYILREPLGAGGMGRVFKAYHPRMRRVVAVKVLAPELLTSAAARARFQREVEAVARLSSPHIVAAHDAGEDRGRDFLVMEYVAGRNLSEVVKRDGPLSIVRAVDYLTQAARGLEHAHAAGIVHRDVKPANLILAAETVKVLDLGLARMDLLAPGGTSLSSSPMVAGTAAFMAPEQAANAHQADARADVYSLGCTLFYLLTGRPPYEGATPMEMLFAHRESQLPHLSRVRPDCPTGLDRLFQRMIARRPEDRPTSMTAVIAELQRLDLCAPPRPGRHLRWIATATTAACVFLAVLSLGPWNAPSAGLVTSRPETSALPLRLPAIEMVRVPAGEFLMGSDDPASPASEQPAHHVQISQPFFLGKYEVTQAQYQEVMGANPSAFGPNGRHRAKVADIDTGAFPVDSVTWLDAVRFCNRLSERHGLPAFYRIDGSSVTVQGGPGFRLPTEAEWEYACRAGSRTRWHFGDSESDLPDFAWTAANSGAATHPVGQKQPNAWGLHDMHGNVPEWCWDRFDEDWYRRSPEIDPAGSGRGQTRVHRGGGWNDAPRQTRSAVRESLGGDYGRFTTLVGLRVARNTQP